MTRSPARAAAGRATRLAAALVALGALGLAAASCDSGVTPPPMAAWPLGDCFGADGPAVLLVGLDELSCLTEQTSARAVLDTAGFLGGRSYVFGQGSEAVLVLQAAGFVETAYRADLSAGTFERLSVSEARFSQIAWAGMGGAERYLVTDYLRNEVPSDTARFQFSWAEGTSIGAPIARSFSVAVPGVGDTALRDVAYSPLLNASAHLFAGLPFGGDGTIFQYLMVVDHDAGTYVLEDVDAFPIAAGVAFLPDGELVVIESSEGRLFSITRGEEILDEGGQPLRIPASVLQKDAAGNVYTFTDIGAGTRVIRVVPDGDVEEVVTLGRRQKALHVSPLTNVMCLREHRPSIWEPPTFDDVVTIVDIASNTMSQFDATLDTDTYRAPRVACL